MKKVNKIQKGIFFIAFFIGIWCLPICSKEAYAATEIELLKTAISHLKEDVVELENQVNTHIQNDSTTDGRDGVDGKDGKDGVDGKNAVIDTEPKKENGSTMGVVATAMASVSLLGNIVLTTFLLKKKKN